MTDMKERPSIYWTLAWAQTFLVTHWNLAYSDHNFDLRNSFPLFLSGLFVTQQKIGRFRIITVLIWKKKSLTISCVVIRSFYYENIISPAVSVDNFCYQGKITNGISIPTALQHTWAYVFEDWIFIDKASNYWYYSFFL